MKFVVALLISISLVSVSTHRVFAQAKDGSLTVSPAYLEITLSQPDEEQTIQLRYTNNSIAPITLEMFSLNFNHTDADGTIGFLAQNADSYSYSLASYLSLSASEVQIDPKQSVVFPVVVRNRPDLTPGGHYGAVIAKIVAGSTSQDKSLVSPSLSTLIFLRKTGGERYNLSLKQTGEEGSLYFSYPKQVQLEFQNEGNVHLVPYGVIEIKDMFGRVIKTGKLNTSSFMVMPESRRNMTVALENITWSFPVSFNTLTVSGNDSLKKTTFLYRNSSFYVNPFLLVILFCCIIGILVYKKKRKTENTKPVQINDFMLERKPKRKRSTSKAHEETR